MPLSANHLQGNGHLYTSNRAIKEQYLACMIFSHFFKINAYHNIKGLGWGSVIPHPTHPPITPPHLTSHPTYPNPMLHIPTLLTCHTPPYPTLLLKFVGRKPAYHDLTYYPHPIPPNSTPFHPTYPHPMLLTPSQPHTPYYLTNVESVESWYFIISVCDNIDHVTTRKRLAAVRLYNISHL